MARIFCSDSPDTPDMSSVDVILSSGKSSSFSFDLDKSIKKLVRKKKISHTK
jgi:hypothetical protein